MTTTDQMRELYRQMLRVTTWEQRLLRFIEEGKTSGFYHSGRGHEASVVGAVAALRPDDYLLYDHRGVGHIIAKGVPLDKMFADFLGNIEGTTRGIGAGLVHIAWPELGVLGQSGTLGGGYPIAAGAGLSAVYRRTDQVVMNFFGDGASNRGTFHEAANVAALWKLPVVWLCQNNGWAVSVAATEALSVPHVADRAAAYGMPGVVVDGMDPVAVYEAAAEAVERAREGGGPTLIEAITQRFRGHYEGDPGSYRLEGEVSGFDAKDPLLIFPKRMLAEGHADEQWLAQVREEVQAEVEEAAAVAERGHKPTSDRLLQYVYA